MPKNHPDLKKGPTNVEDTLRNVSTVCPKHVLAKSWISLPPIALSSAYNLNSFSSMASAESFGVAGIRKLRCWGSFRYWKRDTGAAHPQMRDKTKPEGGKHAAWPSGEVACRSQSNACRRHEDLVFFLRFPCFSSFSIDANRQARLRIQRDRVVRKGGNPHRYLLVSLFRCIWLPKSVFACLICRRFLGC